MSAARPPDRRFCARQDDIENADVLFGDLDGALLGRSR